MRSRALDSLLGGEDALFKRCLLASFFLHVVLLASGSVGGRMGLFGRTPPIEIDLSVPFSLYVGPGRGGAPGPGLPRLGAPRAAPAKPAPPEVPEKPAPEPPKTVVEPETAAEPPKEAVPVPAENPKPEAAQPEAAAAQDSAASAPPETIAPAVPGAAGGSGLGAGTGTGGGGGGRRLRPDVLPRLLNRGEVMRNISRFYPEAERLAGRESKVIVKLHINETGRVDMVDILQSGGQAFDEAAKSVAERMRFSPAMLGGRPILVKIPQLIIFKLD